MTCQNCGHPLTGNRCSNCGWAKPAAPNRAAAILVLIFLVMPFALIGACSVVVGIDAARPGNVSGLGQMIGVAAVFFLLSGAAFAGFYHLWRG